MMDLLFETEQPEERISNAAVNFTIDIKSDAKPPKTTDRKIKKDAKGLSPAPPDVIALAPGGFFSLKGSQP